MACSRKPVARPVLPQPVGPSQTMFCCLGHVVEAVVQRHQPLAVQVRLAVEGERLDLQQFGDVGPFAAEQPGVARVLARYSASSTCLEQPLVRETPLPRPRPATRPSGPAGRPDGDTSASVSVPHPSWSSLSRFGLGRFGLGRFGLGRSAVVLVVDGQVGLVGQAAFLVGRPLAKVSSTSASGSGGGSPWLMQSQAMRSSVSSSTHAITQGPREGCDEHGRRDLAAEGEQLPQEAMTLDAERLFSA